MKPPKKLSKEQLAHPKGEQRSAFNGDLRRPTDEQGFAQRRAKNGLTVVEGTRQVDPKRVKPASYLVRVPQKPQSHQELSDAQRRMLSQRQKDKHRGGKKR